MDSILDLTKKKIGPCVDDGSFDDDIIDEINSAFAILHQLGAIRYAYAIDDSSDEWDDVPCDGTSVLSLIRSYVYLKAKLAFDPPASATILEALQNRVSELEWRLNVEVDPSEYGTASGRRVLRRYQYDSPDGWETDPSFIPKEGEVVIYSADRYSPIRFKVGDGQTSVDELPFADLHDDRIPDFSLEPDGKTFVTKDGRLILVDCPPGPEGKSAYEVAVENGYSGTEVEWLASLKGDKGDTGATGAQGPKGDTGATGAQGPQGQKGDTGATGAQGQKGDDGKSAYEVAVENGYSGTEEEWLASLKGAKGDSGAAGPQGPKGDTGETGATGPQGQKGDTGATGARGPKGDDGKSAYEIAVENGFEGSEQEWLESLIGPSGEQGPTGAPGEPGPTGAPGDPGSDGKSAYEVAVENGFEGSEQEWLESLVGPQGEQGPKGDPGEPFSGRVVTDVWMPDPGIIRVDYSDDSDSYLPFPISTLPVTDTATVQQARNLVNSLTSLARNTPGQKVPIRMVMPSAAFLVRAAYRQLLDTGDFPDLAFSESLWSDPILLLKHVGSFGWMQPPVGSIPGALAVGNVTYRFIIEDLVDYEGVFEGTITVNNDGVIYAECVLKTYVDQSTGNHLIGETRNEIAASINSLTYQELKDIFLGGGVVVLPFATPDYSPGEAGFQCNINGTDEFNTTFEGVYYRVDINFDDGNESFTVSGIYPFD